MQSNEIKTLRVRKERHYSAHHAFLNIAWRALKAAEQEEGHRPHHILICMTFCALALEALANAFGERFDDDWEVFERTSPVARVRILCSTLGIGWDKQQEPFATVVWLAKFRNKVAHAHPQIVKTESVMTQDKYDEQRDEWPSSGLENYLTIENARRSMDQVHALLRLLIHKTPIEKWRGLVADGFTSSSESVESNSVTRTT